MRRGKIYRNKIKKKIPLKTQGDHYVDGLVSTGK